MKICNKKQAKKIECNSKQFVKRVIYVTWRHRKSSTFSHQNMAFPIGGKKKMELNRNEEYPIEKLKSTILEQYITDNNRHYFESSDLNLADSNGEIFTEYVDDEGGFCDFWTFSTCKLRTRYHLLNIVLLTTKIELHNSNVRSENSHFGASLSTDLKDSGIESSSTMAHISADLTQEKCKNCKCIKSTTTSKSSLHSDKQNMFKFGVTGLISNHQNVEDSKIVFEEKKSITMQTICSISLIQQHTDVM